VDSTNSTTEGRTWMGYFQDKLRGQMESSVSAVALAWYLARILSPAITAPFQQKTKPSNSLDKILDLVKNGINGELRIYIIM
jgi:hypothetical protein